MVKYVWRELLIYFAAYFAISATYRFGLNEQQRKVRIGYEM